jgi:hypothetical protein
VRVEREQRRKVLVRVHEDELRRVPAQLTHPLPLAIIAAVHVAIIVAIVIMMIF